MDFSKDDWRILSALLDEALDVPAPERAAWLVKRNDIPEHLRTAASGMIAPEAKSFVLPELPVYAVSEFDDLARDGTSGLIPGESVGAYRLLRELGVGGMGTVWLAQRNDETLKREVALKLPHTTLKQRQLAERFNRERDILAALVHPHIARLYDAGITPQGQPYLALEYVDGQSLTDYCKTHHLSIAERINLFLQVLLAVQYAHSRLVVHRDLKPNNVMVTADGQIRLLDFGIAKLLVDGQANETQLTEIGGRVLTPQYAAPEQILGLPITAAVDIYALGVMLYEIFTGVLPYRPKRDSRGALEDAIVETEVLPPSRAIAPEQPHAGDQKVLRGDLDTIVLKALKKDPAGRYATTAAFADDLRRYLDGDAVLARPDSVLYRWRKFLLRYRWGVAAASVTLMSMSVGLGMALWQRQVAQREAQTARQEARTAQAVSNFMVDVFNTNSVFQSDPLRARNTTVRQLLDIAAPKLDIALNDAPLARINMLRMFADLYSQLMLYDEGLHFRQGTVAMIRQQYGADSTQLAYALGEMAIHMGQLVDHSGSAATLAEIEAILDRHRDFNSNVRGTYLCIASEYFSDHDFTRAQDYVRRCMAIMQNHRQSVEFPLATTYAITIALASADFVAAKAMALDGLTMARELTQRKSPGGRQHVASLLLYLARAEWGLGDMAAAESHFRQAIEDFQQTLGDGNDRITSARLIFADFLLQSGRSKEGRELLGTATSYRVYTQARPAVDSFRYLMLRQLGRTQLNAGQYAQALDSLSQALAMRSSGISASAGVAGVLRDQARALAALKRLPQASETVERAIAMRARSGLKSSLLDQEEADLRKEIGIK